MIKVEIDGNQFALAASRYVREVGGSMPKVLRAQTRLLLRDILRFTPPKSYAQGRKAVAGDLGRAVSVLDQNSFDRMKQGPRERLRALIRKKDIAGLNAFLNALKANGTIKRGQVVPFSPSLHTSQRTRYGRVGSWKGNYTLDKSAWTAYRRKLWSAVGWARAGWNAAAAKVGIRMPSWVAKHGTSAGGSSCIEIAGDIPAIVITHRTSKIPGYPSSVRAALRNRVRSMNRDVDRLLRAAKAGKSFQESTRLDIFE